MSDQKVYIVTDGTYSEYHIQRVFLDRAAAEVFTQLEGGQIEEWAVGPTPEPFKGKLWHAHYLYGPRGGTMRLTQVSHEGAKPPRAEVIGREYDYVTVWGTSKEYVEKVIQDEMGRMKAERAGIA